jgi:hypothetical protein
MGVASSQINANVMNDARIQDELAITGGADTS